MNQRINRIATFNIRGINNDYDKLLLAMDADKYKTEIIALSQTHIPEEELLCKIRTNKTTYILFSCNNNKEKAQHGAGFLIKENLNPIFKRITDRRATATIPLKERKLLIMAIYAPTLQICENNPNVREDLYNQIQTVIDKIPKKDL